LTLERFDFETAEDDWRRVADRSDNIFDSWEWARTWWHHFRSGEELRLLGLRGAGHEPRVLLPLTRSWRLGVPMLRFLGHGPGDQLGPICAVEDRDLAAEGLRQALEESSDWAIFLGERLPGDWPVDRTLGGRSLSFESSPALVVGGRSWDDLLKERSSNFRQQVRRRERKLVRDHGLKFRFTADPGELDRDLDLLFGLHVARWEGQDTRFSQTRRFHRAFAALALERGWLRLWIAEVGGRPAAAWYGFRYAGIESFYQTGRDPAFDSTSVGFVLLTHTIRSAVEDGVSEYRFLRGGEHYKGRFSNRDVGLRTLAVARTAVGRVAVDTAATLARRSRGRGLMRQAPI